MATGTVPNPEREVFIELARRVTVDGGKVLSARHSGRPIAYPQSASDAARKQAEDGARTCNCGDHRQVMISYQRADDENPELDVEKHYIACVNCDAVGLQPRWFTGKWAQR